MKYKRRKLQTMQAADPSMSMQKLFENKLHFQNKKRVENLPSREKMFDPRELYREKSQVRKNKIIIKNGPRSLLREQTGSKIFSNQGFKSTKNPRQSSYFKFHRSDHN